jgi:hypothetical protein
MDVPEQKLASQRSRDGFEFTGNEIQVVQGTDGWRVTAILDVHLDGQAAGQGPLGNVVLSELPHSTEDPIPIVSGEE